MTSPNTGRALFPLSYESKVIELSLYLTGVLHIARFSTQNFFHFLSHARVMLVNAPFTFYYRAQNLTSYSLITTHDDFDSDEPSSMQDACQF